MDFLHVRVSLGKNVFIALNLIPSSPSSSCASKKLIVGDLIYVM